MRIFLQLTTSASGSSTWLPRITGIDPAYNNKQNESRNVGRVPIPETGKMKSAPFTPCCGSGPDPGSGIPEPIIYIFSIPDLGSKTTKRGEKISCLIYPFCSHEKQ
jgi:hypothetical protein